MRVKYHYKDRRMAKTKMRDDTKYNRDVEQLKFS